jgi:CheY-like chemotaxis protein
VNRVLLIAEDDSAQTILMKCACHHAGISSSSYRFVSNGAEAISYLEKAKLQTAENPLPAAVVMDLKMPLSGGFDVLTWIRENGQFQQLPVFLFSCAVSAEQQSRATSLSCNGLFEKPGKFEDLVLLVRKVWALGDFS